MKPKTQDVNHDQVRNDPPGVKQKRLAWEQLQGQVLEWYMAMTGKMPEEQHYYTDAHGRTQWRLEPEIPGCDNPVIVEHCTTRGWSLELVPVPSKTKIFVP